MLRLCRLVLLFLTLVDRDLPAQDCLPAFPGAVGFGACAAGGRGGDVYPVTSLLDGDLPDGAPGTLRHAISSAVGPRTVVFDVGGTIVLAAALDIVTDRMTLAGQTAPGGGISVAGYAMSVRADDVVVRYMRFRCGDFNAQFPGGKDRLGTPGVGNGNADLIGNNGDALRTHSADRLVLDHVSAS